MVKNLPASEGDIRDAGSISGSGRSPEEGAGQHTPGFLPGESHGQRSLEGYSLWGQKESDMTEVTEQACMRKIWLQFPLQKETKGERCPLKS